MTKFFILTAIFAVIAYVFRVLRLRSQTSTDKLIIAYVWVASILIWITDSFLFAVLMFFVNCILLGAITGFGQKNKENGSTSPQNSTTEQGNESPTRHDTTQGTNNVLRKENLIPDNIDRDFIRQQYQHWMDVAEKLDAEVTACDTEAKNLEQKCKEYADETLRLIDKAESTRNREDMLTAQAMSNKAKAAKREYEEIMIKFKQLANQAIEAMENEKYYKELLLGNDKPQAEQAE